MNYENLFSTVGIIRISVGVIFALFILCFVAIIIEETFFGGRRRRRAEKQARERESTAIPAPQNSDTPHHQ